ncbi:MAG: TIGR01244 family sulfur transferase [Pseudooceanicola sp.]
MDIRQVTPRYSVSPQITPDDVAAIKAAGFTRIICNRPDSENPPELQAAAIGAAAREAGLEFVDIPLTYPTMTPDVIAGQMAAAEEASGPVLAYCASGTRCTTIWALGRATAGDAPEGLIETAAKAGYDLSGLKPRLDQLSS